MVVLAVTPDNRWEASPEELVGATAGAGFDALGILGEHVTPAVAAAYDAAGLRCHEVLALVLGEDDEAASATATALAGAARAVGAPWVLTVFTEPMSPAMADRVRRCAAILDAAGVGMAAEFSPLGPVATIADALAAVDAARRAGARAGVLVDTWHFCRGASTWDDLATVPLDDIAYVQFTDAHPPGADSPVAQALHRRTVPGEGVLELDRFAGTLLDRGWDGTVSLEVLDAGLRALGIDEILRRLHEAAVRYWR